MANECGMEKETEIGQRRKAVLRGRFRSAESAMTGGGHRVKGELAAEEMRTTEVPHTITLGENGFLAVFVQVAKGWKERDRRGRKKGLFRLSTPFMKTTFRREKRRVVCVLVRASAPTQKGFRDTDKEKKKKATAAA